MEAILSTSLSDGFHELTVFRGHSGTVRNFFRVDPDSKFARYMASSKKNLFVSVDPKQMILWEQNQGHIQRSIKFPKSQLNFITAIVYVTK